MQFDRLLCLVWLLGDVRGRGLHWRRDRGGIDGDSIGGIGRLCSIGGIERERAVDALRSVWQVF
jgi:hypothetical protein